MVFAFISVKAQTVKDFFYVEPETKNLPVFIRGNLSTHKIILFVQGGPAHNGIDFGRSDYPKWKNTLETEVAIAYFDQRGLNRSVKKIDTTSVNPTQVSIDIISIARALKEKYKADIYLLGHSAGGQEVLDCLAAFPEKTRFIKAGMVLNAPVTTDFSRMRYTYYRPLYLKNLAKEFIVKEKDTAYWQQAWDWITQTDSIHNAETSRQWNAYVDRAYTPTKRKISIGMVVKVLFSRPYNPVSYFNNKDNQRVADKLWEADRNLDRFKNIAHIQHPVLLLTGRFDDIAVPEELEEAQHLIPKATLTVLPNCGHESFLDQPEACNQAILTFLAAH